MHVSKCRVCLKPSHGIHFGADSCRACAAFFRRAVLFYADLKCRKGDGKCEQKLGMCKKCRLEKCFTAGMNEKKLQLGRDPVCLVRKKRTSSVQYYVGRPAFIFTDSNISQKSDRLYIDFTKLIEKASTILDTDSKLYVGMNTLNKLTYALKNSTQTPKTCERIGKNEIFKLWEIGFLKVAEWFKYCDKFQQLPLNMRIEFLKTVWTTWSCLQNFVSTANRNLVFKERNEFIFLIHDYVIDVKTLDLDLTWLTKYRKEHLLEPASCSKRNQLVGDLMNLNPTFQEITYMLSIFSFRRAAKMLHGDFEELNEIMIDTLGNEMHSYYINEMKLIHYSQRMSKMMNIVNIIERNFYEKMEKVELARMFDVITVDFSHPELIYGQK